MAHHQDFELAQSVLRELMQLRSRATPASAEEVQAIARKAAISSDERYQSRANIDKARADAGLTLCRLAGLLEHEVTETTTQWTTAIDRAELWVREAE